MTNKEIQRELTKIYKAMRNWQIENKNYPNSIPANVVSRRESILYLERTLCRIIDSRKTKNSFLECFSLADYYSLKAFVLLSENAKNN